jgi:thioesterase domain-containing protein
MWRARTIRELARGIARGDTGRAAPIVPIDLHGRGEPLVLVHPAGGSVMAYSRLGAMIDRPLYGIQASTTLDDANRRRDVGALAAGYVSELRTLQADGPYSIGGWSSGAMIAFEMAAQLEAAGACVRQVFVLDGPAPVDHGDTADEQLLRWFLEDLAIELPLARLDGERFNGLPIAEQLRKAQRLLEADDRVDLESLASNFEVFRDVIHAGSRYRPRPIAAALTIVRVDRDVVSEFSTHPSRRDADWGWRRFTTGPVRCVRVAGTHHTFLKAPLVDSWCGLFDEVDPPAVVRM